MQVLALRVVAGTDSAEGAGGVDAELLTAAARKDQNAFEKIVHRHYQVVYRVVWRLMNGHRDAEDVTQETFLRLWKNPAQIREPGALRGWLFRTASNLVNDRFRHKQPASLDGANLELESTGASAETLLERDWVSRRMDQAIAHLPERQKLALLLVQFEHMSHQAVAGVMEISVDALESLLARARRTLKQELADDWRNMIAALADKG